MKKVFFKLIIEKIDIYNLIRNKVTKLQTKMNSNLMISPKNNINISNNIINNMKSNILNDHEFVTTLNLLSCNIKEFYKNYKKELEVLKTNHDSLTESILLIKNQFTEYSTTVLGLTAFGFNKNKTISSKPILENLNKTLEKKHLISSNIRAFEKTIIIFYDDSKSLFKSLKLI